MIPYISEAFVRLSKAAWLAGADWQTGQPKADEDAAARIAALVLPKSAESAPLRQAQDLLHQLEQIRPEPLPDYLACDEDHDDDLASCPIFSEGYLYPALGKESARTVLAVLRGLRQSFGLADPGYPTFTAPAAAQDAAADVGRAAFLEGSRWARANLGTEQKDDSAWNEARRLFPYAHDVNTGLDIAPVAVKELLLLTLDYIQTETVDTDGLPVRFMDPDVLRQLVGADAAAKIRDILLALTELAGVDAAAAETAWTEDATALRDFHRSRDERSEVIRQFSLTGRHHLHELAPETETELRAHYPLQARLTLAPGQQVVVPFAKRHPRWEGYAVVAIRVEAASPLRTTKAVWSPDEVELIEP